MSAVRKIREYLAAVAEFRTGYPDDWQLDNVAGTTLTIGDLRELVEGEAWFTVAEVATRMRVSKMTVYRMVESGTLPGVKFGRSFRVKVTDFDAYLEENRTG